jgi:hypothetical protein
MNLRIAIGATIAALLLTASSARAGDAAAAAQALFDEGKRLMAEGRYEQACPKFDESQRTDPGLGTQFHLADCWQHLGREASAWALFREVQSGARVLGQVSRERVARGRADAIEPRLPKLVLSPHGAFTTPALEIRRDGAVVGREQWNQPVPVDPGPHVITVFAPGKRPWEATVSVGSVGAEGKSTTVDVPPLADLADVASGGPAPTRFPTREAPPPPVQGVTSAMPTGGTETVLLENRGAVQRAVGWILVGAGAIGMATGAYFAVTVANDINQANPHCQYSFCDAIGSQLHHDASVFEATSIATAAIGGAAVLVGGLLVGWAPGPRVTITGGTQIAPIVGHGTAGLSLRGGW